VGFARQRCVVGLCVRPRRGRGVQPLRVCAAAGVPRPVPPRRHLRVGGRGATGSPRCGCRGGGGGGYPAGWGGGGGVSEMGSAPIVRALPWIGLGVGVVLVLTGGLALMGRHIGSSVPQRVADRIGRRAGAAGLRGYAAFGLAYGAASLGCTLPLFLALMG